MNGPVDWEPDVLGPGFESTVLVLAQPDGSRRIATLVRYRSATALRRAAAPLHTVLFLHGWSDYFFNTDLAKFFDEMGIGFYALDMHNHGRSLRPGDMGGYVRHLEDYDDELNLAVELVIGDVETRWASQGIDAAAPRVALMGHSTGGLVAALWASRHQDRVSHLILNSPWIEMHGGALVRRTAQPMMRPLARMMPRTRMRLPERNFYWRSISDEASGEWQLDAALRPPKAFPIRMAWMSAILKGQAAVAKGLDLQMPIVVLISARSQNGPFWKESMHQADVVLDVGAMAVRALSLGSRVTIERIDGGLHDVLLSRKSVRDDAYSRLRQWINGYMLHGGSSK